MNARDRGKTFANRGVERNKKPLQNILYRFEEHKKDGITYYIMLWGHERDLNKNGSWNFHGKVSEDEIKARIGVNGWAKFRQGKRDFIKHRRIDGRNIPVNK